jgi:hypothetical protein
MNNVKQYIMTWVMLTIEIPYNEVMKKFKWKIRLFTVSEIRLKHMSWALCLNMCLDLNIFEK